MEYNTPRVVFGFSHLRDRVVIIEYVAAFGYDNFKFYRYRLDVFFMKEEEGWFSYIFGKKCFLLLFLS